VQKTHKPASLLFCIFRNRNSIMMSVGVFCGRIDCCYWWHEIIQSLSTYSVLARRFPYVLLRCNRSLI